MTAVIDELDVKRQAIDSRHREVVISRIVQTAERFGGSIGTWKQIKAGDKIIVPAWPNPSGEHVEVLEASIDRDPRYVTYRVTGARKRQWTNSDALVIFAPASR